MGGGHLELHPLAVAVPRPAGPRRRSGGVAHVGDSEAVKVEVLGRRIGYCAPVSQCEREREKREERKRERERERERE